MGAALATAELSVAQYDRMEAGLEDILKVFVSEEYERVSISCTEYIPRQF
jgi:hypothetical protein